jgi:hypothetical protein
VPVLHTTTLTKQLWDNGVRFKLRKTIHNRKHAVPQSYSCPAGQVLPSSLPVLTAPGLTAQFSNTASDKSPWMDFLKNRQQNQGAMPSQAAMFNQAAMSNQEVITPRWSGQNGPTTTHNHGNQGIPRNQGSVLDQGEELGARLSTSGNLDLLSHQRTDFNLALQDFHANQFGGQLPGMPVADMDEFGEYMTAMPDQSTSNGQYWHYQ